MDANATLNLVGNVQMVIHGADGSMVVFKNGCIQSITLSKGGNKALLMGAGSLEATPDSAINLVQRGEGTTYVESGETHINGNGTTHINGDGETHINGAGKTCVEGDGETQINGTGTTNVNGSGNTVVFDEGGKPLVSVISGQTPTIRAFDTLPGFPTAILFERTGDKASLRIADGVIAVTISNGDTYLRRGETDLTASGNSLTVRSCDEVELHASGQATVTAHTVTVEKATVVKVEDAITVYVQSDKAEVLVPNTNCHGALEPVASIVAQQIAAAQAVGGAGGQTKARKPRKSKG